MQPSALLTAQLRDLAVAKLQRRCSDLLMQRILRRLEALDTTGADHECCFESVRVAVRLFVDEALAEELYQDLRRLAGLT